MIIHTPELARWLRSEQRTDSVRIRILDQDGTVRRELIPVDGSIPADRKQAQMRSFEVQVVDPTGELVPDTLEDLLAPGWLIQVERGTKIELVVVHEQRCHTAQSWAANGELVSCVVDGSGALTLSD